MHPTNQRTALVVPFSKKSVGRAKTLIGERNIHMHEAINEDFGVHTLSAATANADAPISSSCNLAPPSYLTDNIATEEWRRTAPILVEHGVLSPVMVTLLAGYCNALSRTVHAEEIMRKEGRYYSTKNARGSTLKRRHPAVKDAEDGWAAVMQFAKHIQQHTRTKTKDAEKKINALFK